jgi:hypothetical protein
MKKLSKMTEKEGKKFLFDNIYEKSMSLKQLKKTEEKFCKEMFGTLSVIARDDTKICKDGKGKIIHYEKPSLNKVLVWAKHCMIKLTAGDIMCRYGANRITPNGNNIYTGKGTLISNRQFFSEDTGSFLNDYNYIANSFTGYSDMKHPYFPTKMLFGTGNSQSGIAFPAKNDINSDQESEITDQDDTLSIPEEGWVQSVHTSGEITGLDNYGIGAGQNWENFTINEYKHFLSGANQWLPSFIYIKRSRPFENNSEMSIDKYIDDNPEYNKITFSVDMPSQLTGRWYPYNKEQYGRGVELKYAGLFCDAAWVNYSGTTELYVETGSPGEEFQTGIMWAKRAIAPIIKTENISLQFFWTLYIPR